VPIRALLFSLYVSVVSKELKKLIFAALKAGQRIKETFYVNFQDSKHPGSRSSYLQ